MHFVTLVDTTPGPGMLDVPTAAILLEYHYGGVETPMRSWLPIGGPRGYYRACSKRLPPLQVLSLLGF